MRNDTTRPASLAELFLTLTWLALQGFGGVVAVVQQQENRGQTTVLAALAIDSLIFLHTMYV